MPIKSKHTAQKRSSKKKNFWKYPLLLITFLILLFTVYVIFVPAKYWDGKTRLALAIADHDGGVRLAVFDPQTESITTLTVPSNTEVDVTRQLGSWKMGSVWQLGKNEKIGGSIISETATRALHLPTEAWADYAALGLTQDNTLAIWKSVLSNYKTNLNLKDRLSIGLFAQSVKSPQRTQIDLAQTPLLVKTKLADGSLGYHVRDSAVAQISAYFGDAQISTENMGVTIYYPRSRMQEVQTLGEIIQILGVKVTALEPLSQDINFDCIISSEKSLTTDKLADIFNCKVENKNNQTDVQFKVGENFFKRF